MDADALLPALLGHDDWIRQPIWVPHFPNDVGLLQLVDLLHDERLLLRGLSPCFLLHRARAEAHHQVVLNHISWDADQVCCFPCKYIFVRTEETDQHLFLVRGEASAYGEGGVRAPVVDQHLHRLRPVLREQLALICGHGFQGPRSVFGA